MGESRDANDPRDLLRAMNKEARAEFEGEETGDTGGQEHARREDRDGDAASRRESESGMRGRSVNAQQDADRERKPDGGDLARGGGGTAGASPVDLDEE
jgi:hypothetical protein